MLQQKVKNLRGTQNKILYLFEILTTCTQCWDRESQSAYQHNCGAGIVKIFFKSSTDTLTLMPVPDQPVKPNPISSKTFKFLLESASNCSPATRAARKIIKKSRSRFTHTRDLISTHSDSEAFYIWSWITNKCSYFPPGFFEAPPNAALPMPPPSTCGKASLQHVIQWRKPTCSWVFTRSEWETVFRQGSKPPVCPSYWLLGPRF